jgi:beta-alanine--pyruvate transaminase
MGNEVLDLITKGNVMAYQDPQDRTKSVASASWSMKHHWLPFTPNRHFQEIPRVFVKADGMHFTTHDGSKVLDGISSLWCVGAGHNRREINEAVKQQLDTLDYATAFNAGNDKAFMAADKISSMAPGDLNKVLFCNSGSEAADTAMKVALAYHRARGEGHRNVFIGRERGYHGVGFGGMSIGGIPANRKVFGTALLPRIDHMRFIHDPVNHAYIQNTEPEWAEDPLLELENRILPLHDPSNVAAIIVEPVAGSAGWYIGPKGYLKRLREICNKHGILLVFDEVITGFGRMGKTFAADYFGVIPDMLNFAKCVTNGVQPLGGVLCRDHVYEAIAKPETPDHIADLFHGYTYSGHPVPCSAALATLALYEQENLFERANAMGKVLGDAMHSALRGLPNVISIRSLGLAAAVELSPEVGAPGRRAYNIFLDCFQRGVLVRSAGDNLVFAPPFIVTEAQIDQMVSTLATSIRRLA